MKIRRSMFETNSSSSHSISIDISDDGILSSKLYPGDDGLITINCGEYGWEIEYYTDAETKVSYLLTDIFSNFYGNEKSLDEINKHVQECMESEKYKMLSKVIREHTGHDLRVMYNRDSSFYPFGYIDHQSEGTVTPVYESEDKLRSFIFNPHYILRTDNDNH